MLQPFKGFIRLIWPLIRKWRKFRYPEKISMYEKNLLLNYQLPEKKNLIPRIIFMLDENFSQGGFVDRVKGIVTAYYISNITGLPFCIYLKDSTDPIFKILNEKHLTILNQSTDLVFSQGQSVPIVWYNYLPKTSSDILNRLNGNYEYHLYCNMDALLLLIQDKKSYPLVWSNIFHTVFDFQLINKSVFADTLLIGKTIGIHLRFIGLLGDFKDLRDIQLSEEIKNSMEEWCRYTIFQIAKENVDSIIYIVSDSRLFLDKLKSNLISTEFKSRICINDGEIGHTAVVKSEEVFIKTITDFIGLSRCTKVYQLRYGKMHKSDFSRYAAMVNLIPFEIIEPDVKS